jgi:hypothetical protein
MSEVNALASRIDAEFSAVEQKMKQFRTGQLEEHKQRKTRLEPDTLQPSCRGGVPAERGR